LIVSKHRHPAQPPDSRDDRSFRVMVLGMWVATALPFPLAWVAVRRFPPFLQPAMFVLGTAIVVAGSLLRRHCFALLGKSFTGDVRARPDQPIVTTGAYTLLRHPSYTAGILMNAGIGVPLGSWGSTIVLVVASLAVYGYRIAV